MYFSYNNRHIRRSLECINETVLYCDTEERLAAAAALKLLSNVLPEGNETECAAELSEAICVYSQSEGVCDLKAVADCLITYATPAIVMIPEDACL